MKRSFLLRATSLVALLTLLIGGAVVTSAQTRKKKPVLTKKTTTKKTTKPAAPVIPVYTLALGTKMRVRMEDTISSKSAKAGDTFIGTIVDPVYAEGGALVIPDGSKITGKITAAAPAQRKGKPGTIDVSFVSVQMPNGATQAINGSLTDLDAGKTSSDAEGTASGDTLKNRHIIFIGGGTAGGALLGAIAGGGKGAGIGAIAGAGAGVAADLLLKGPEAEVKPGTEFGVILNQAVSMHAYK